MDELIQYCPVYVLSQMVVYWTLTKKFILLLLNRTTISQWKSIISSHHEKNIKYVHAGDEEVVDDVGYKVGTNGAGSTYIPYFGVN